eukprot:1135064-Heterocapsa_arctica.AAC.1
MREWGPEGMEGKALRKDLGREWRLARGTKSGGSRVGRGPFHAATLASTAKVAKWGVEVHKSCEAAGVSIRIVEVTSGA